MNKHHEEVHRFVKGRAGDAYRAAFWYQENDWEPIYIRDDVRTEALKENISEAIERARETEALLREEDYPPLGEANATTELHEYGVMVHIKESENEGIIISLDRDAARRLAGFVSQCLYILNSPSPPAYQASSATGQVSED